MSSVEEKAARTRRMTTFYEQESKYHTYQVESGCERRARDIMQAHVGTTGQASRRHMFKPSRLGIEGGPHDAYTDGTICSSRP